MAAFTEFQIPYALPLSANMVISIEPTQEDKKSFNTYSSGRQTTIGDRNVHRRTDKSRLDMSLGQVVNLVFQSCTREVGVYTNRHIILALGRMTVKVSLLVHWDDSVQSIAHIGADIVVPILVQRERAARVLNEQVEHANLVVADLGHLL